MQFHLAHIVPSKGQHGMHGYKEVVDTVRWGLEQLGHKVTYGLNSLSGAACNIIFGAQGVRPDVLAQLPPETIIYNFEQARGGSAEHVLPAIRDACRRMRIWDYSTGNLAMWQSLGARSATVVPVGYAPVLQRIGKSSEQDIDVLMYGMPGEDRLGAFHFLAHQGLTAVFVCGLYGKARDDLIARSRLVLNINLYQHAKIFEVVRVSYLLANRKAVVADVDAQTLIDDDMRAAVAAVDSSQLVDTCRRLAADDAARTQLEEAGFAAIVRRDIRPILERALDGA